MEKKKLPDAVAAKFDMNPAFAVGNYHFKGEKINLETISPEKAEQIVSNGFDVLIPKKASPPQKQGEKS